MVDMYRKNKSLSMMKLVLLLLIFLSHSFLFFVDNKPYWILKASVHSGFFEWCDKFMYYFAIQIFVFASGFLFTQSYQKKQQPLHNIIKSRFKRLIIPLFLVGTLWLVPLYTLFNIPAFAHPAGSTLVEGYRNYFQGLFVDHLWFLLILFWSTLTCVLLLPMVKKQMFLSFLVVLLAALGAQLFLGSIDYYHLASVALPILCFGCGMIFFHAKDVILLWSIRRRRLFVWILFALMVGLICVDLGVFGSNIYLRWAISIMGCITAYYLFDFLQYVQIANKIYSSRFCQWIDGNSMELYMFHMPFPLLFFIFVYPLVKLPIALFVILNFLFTLGSTSAVVWVILRLKKWRTPIFHRLSRKKIES